jgi:hypothetical protein
LAGRDAGNLRDLLRPHNEHWTTLPILAYRLLWNVFGLNSYRPYQFLVIALHLTAAVLLRVIMRRSGVSPWIATAAATMFVLLGASGAQNIIWAFQITFVGSLVCGLAHLLLADHDGPVDRRDAAGLAFGLAALLCSGVGVTMAGVAGLAVLIRRGPRAAALHVLPLAAVFGAWWLAFARSKYDASGASARTVAQFAQHGVANAFDRAGGFPGIGVALGVMLIIGLLTAWARQPREELRRRAAVPVAMLSGSLVFLCVTALGRGAGFGIEFAERTRYVHLVVALIVPALGVAADGIARRWRAVTPILIVLFLVGVPGNMGDLWQERSASARQFAVAGPVRGGRGLLLAVAHSPALDAAAPQVRPFPGPANRDITVAWLRHVRDRGRLPDDAPSPDDAATATMILALRQTGDSESTGPCTPFEARTSRLEQGEWIDFRGSVLVRLLGDDGGRSAVFGYASGSGSRLLAVAGPLTLELAPYPGLEAVECA